MNKRVLFCFVWIFKSQDFGLCLFWSRCPWKQENTNLSRPRALFVQALCLMFHNQRNPGPPSPLLSPQRKYPLKAFIHSSDHQDFHWCSESQARAWFTHTINQNKNSDYNILSLSHSPSFSFSFILISSPGSPSDSNQRRMHARTDQH